MAVEIDGLVAVASGGERRRWRARQRSRQSCCRTQRGAMASPAEPPRAVGCPAAGAGQGWRRRCARGVEQGGGAGRGGGAGGSGDALGLGKAVEAGWADRLVGSHGDQPAQHGQRLGAVELIEGGVAHARAPRWRIAMRFCRNRGIVSPPPSTITGAIAVEPTGDGTRWKRNRSSASRWSSTCYRRRRAGRPGGGDRSPAARGGGRHRSRSACSRDRDQGAPFTGR